MTTEAAVREAWAAVEAALPVFWFVDTVQWGDNHSGPGPGQPWHATALGPMTSDPEERDGRIGSGATAAEALVALAANLGDVQP